MTDDDIPQQKAKHTSPESDSDAEGMTDGDVPAPQAGLLFSGQ